MIPLLPYEKFLISQFGISEEQYQQFKALALKHSIEKPADGPVAGPVIVPFLINLAIGIGLSLLSALLFPQDEGRPEVKVKRKGGENLRSNQRLSPRFGFNSIQEPAQVGQLTPVVVAKRENGRGGVRVAMPMIWSQLLSLRGSQMFRGIFLAGVANMAAAAWDPRGWAFGNNTLGAYAYSDIGDTEGGRYSIYYRRGGGRIRGGDLVAGRRADKDIGNAERYGGQDVYAITLGNNEYKQAFCMSEAPSTSTTFGLYSWCPNAMFARIAITIRPMRNAYIREDGKVGVDDDTAVMVDWWKGYHHWSMRAGLIAYKEASGSWTTPVTSGYGVQELSVVPGTALRYRLSKQTDATTKVRFDEDNTDIDEGGESEEKMTEVASVVASVQNAADSALVPGELFKIGTAWAVLEERQPEVAGETVFISEQEQEPPAGGTGMDYVFIVVKAGNVQFVGPDIFHPPETGTLIKPPASKEVLPPVDGYETRGRYKVCSQAAQVFRLAIGAVSTVREVSVIEIGLRSRVGITVNNMTEYRSCPTYEKIHKMAGEGKQGKDVGDRLSVTVYNSNTISTRITRYSTFRVYYRSLAQDWQEFPDIIAIASNTGEDVYSYIRLRFASAARWEVRFEPVASWEIRRDAALSRIVIMDSTSLGEVVVSAGGVTLVTTGYVRNPQTDITLKRADNLEPEVEIGIGLSDTELNSMFDGYARFAEAFCYDNVQSTVGNSPEHEIVYVNYPSDLDKTPSYQCLATVGTNVLASLEFTNLQQFSGFCTAGYEMRQLLANDAVGSSHLFPDWLRELMTSTEVGPSPPIPDMQIDRASFQTAAQWCQDREYFYDAVEGEPLNILQWASDTAQAHLLKLVRIGGIYHLQPAVEFNNPLPIAGLFTNGNIREESFRFETFDYQARQPFRVEVKWREESTDVTTPLFARERVATVYEVGTPANAPVESLDLSDWCTNYKQAIDAACFLTRFRRLADHRISFDTTPDLMGAQLASGSIIKLAIDVTNYDQAVQGFITNDGTLVTTRPDLAPSADGSYPALLWDGTANDAAAGTITIAGGVASPAGRFFAIAAPQTTTRTYEIKKLSFSADGIVTVEAFHHPTDAAGMSLLGVNWTTYQTDANWVVEF